MKISALAVSSLIVLSAASFRVEAQEPVPVPGMVVPGLDLEFLPRSATLGDLSGLSEIETAVIHALKDKVLTCGFTHLAVACGDYRFRREVGAMHGYPEERPNGQLWNYAIIADSQSDFGYFLAISYSYDRQSLDSAKVFRLPTPIAGGASFKGQRIRDAKETYLRGELGKPVIEFDVSGDWKKDAVANLEAVSIEQVYHAGLYVLKLKHPERKKLVATVNKSWLARKVEFLSANFPLRNKLGVLGYFKFNLAKGQKHFIRQLSEDVLKSNKGNDPDVVKAVDAILEGRDWYMPASCELYSF